MKGKGLVILVSSFCLILVLTSLLFLPACTTGPTADKPLVLRYSSGLPPVDLQVKDMEYFAEEVGKRTGGKIIIEVYSGAELFDVHAGAEAVIQGAVEMAQGAPGGGQFPEYNPMFEVLEVYFMWRSRDHVRTHIEDYRDLLFPMFEEVGVVPLHFFDRGQGGVISTESIMG